MYALVHWLRQSYVKQKFPRNSAISQQDYVSTLSTWYRKATKQNQLKWRLKFDPRHHRITLAGEKGYFDTMGRIAGDSANKLPFRLVLGYGLGHVFNDICASLWFTYLLIFLQKVNNLSFDHPFFVNDIKRYSPINVKSKEKYQIIFRCASIS